MAKNVIIYGADMNSFAHIHYKNKDILILGERTRDGLDGTTLTAEAKFYTTKKKICHKCAL